MQAHDFTVRRQLVENAFSAQPVCVIDESESHLGGVAGRAIRRFKSGPSVGVHRIIVGFQVSWQPDSRSPSPHRQFNCCLGAGHRKPHWRGVGQKKSRVL